MIQRRHLARIGLAGAVAIVATFALLDHLLPLDLSRLSDRSVVVVDRDGGLLRAFAARDGRWRLPIDAEQVDAGYRRMLLAYEDKRFDSHPGIDPFAVGRALSQWISNGRVVSGASTLTMQTVRLLEPRPRTWGSKLIEMARALQLEWRYAKRDILSMYLTLAPYGGNIEGVRAATLLYFGKEPAHLTDAEAALLVALPQSPERLRPDRFPAAAATARDRVLTRMAEIGLLAPRSAQEAMGERVPDGRWAVETHAPHLAERLRAAGAAAGVVHTFIDRTLQARLEALGRQRQAGLEAGATIAILVVENAGRRVLAYIGSSDFSADAALGQNDMVRAVRSPGSTLKPFVYGLAFDALLLHPESILVDAPARFGDYAPQNFDRIYRGEVTAREALQLSLNVPAVAVLDRLGPGRLAQSLADAGAPLRFPRGLARPGLPIALGGAGSTLEGLVTLYAALANHGEAALLRYTSDDSPPAPTTFVSPAAAWYLTSILEQTPPPPRFLAEQNRKGGRAIAFKTGTSYGFRDAWAIGYDRDHTVGVWVGRPDGSFSPGRMGREAAAPILFEVLDQLPRTAIDPGPDSPPDGVILAGNADLPPNLRRFQPRSETREAGRAAHDAPAILFPVDGSTVELSRRDGAFDELPLQAAGGRPPLLWLVNGTPIAASPFRRQTQWQPDGPGLSRVSVIDRTGRSATAEVWIK